MPTTCKIPFSLYHHVININYIYIIDYMTEGHQITKYLCSDTLITLSSIIQDVYVYNESLKDSQTQISLVMLACLQDTVVFIVTS